MCKSVCESEHVESRGICQVSPATLYLFPLRLALTLPFFSESGRQQAPHPRVSILNTVGPHPASHGCGALNSGPHSLQQVLLLLNCLLTDGS